ncbi:MAG TPA: hypothetical protein VFT71_01735 [Candidatus Nitrosocosmicus sp.]|nr:hypothetical protein [Candidatus Nitrosocosmicus sp.]
MAPFNRLFATFRMIMIYTQREGFENIDQFLFSVFVPNHALRKLVDREWMRSAQQQTILLSCSSLIIK